MVVSLTVMVGSLGGYLLSMKRRIRPSTKGSIYKPARLMSLRNVYNYSHR